ncbi:response regulator with -like receiver domain protein and winged-helix dna-binding domain protein [Leptolyngbya sp. Heron Island J]|uniref:response regulator transcription factor n=1 Tax=Leptolyngbya sp. Heron Island J TaxID=1385935 RepID=UPI0003B9A4A9|nr:response regulator [Leptolyngbya sp. Heron Island J]ESA35688.1 response regulator with -like receiver domain protein and winged-helix dna-binding domain protein [Leptolyngbya sp. Heron Island J]
MATILIVEDEPQIVAFLSKGLRRAGYQIQVAADGIQAMSLVASGEIDLVLLDLGLPVLDGTSVLSATRAQGIQIPVIVVTARAGDDEREKSLALGANDYISKPFRFSELLSCVRSYV